MPKLDIELPPPPVSGGESSVAPDARRKKPGKPDAKLVPTRRMSRFDKARLRQRIIEASNKRRNRVIQGVVVPKRPVIQGRPIGSFPFEYSGLIRGDFFVMFSKENGSASYWGFIRQTARWVEVHSTRLHKQLCAGEQAGQLLPREWQ